MYLLDGKKINVDSAMTIEGTQYPPGHFRDAEARDAAGITEVPDPVRPDERFYFINENDDGSLTVTPKATSSILDMLWGWITTYRDTLMAAGCEVGVHWFHNDIKSRSQWERMTNRANNSAMLGADPYTISGQQVPWKTMSGVFVPLTAGLIREVVAEFEVQEVTIFMVAEQHRDALAELAQADDVAGMAAYDWHAGWPAVYGEPV